MSAFPEPYLDGWPVSTIAPWANPEYIERLSGGCWEASWDMRVPQGWNHPIVRRGAHVEMRLGGAVLWSGVLSEPDRDSWRLTAQGYSREAEHFDALNSDGSAATNVSVATAEAISRGLPWATGVLPSWPAHANPVAATETDSINRLSTLWDAAAEASGRFWGVGPDQHPYAVERPTEAVWRTSPGSVTLGVADDEFVTHLNGRYLTGSGFATVTRGNDAAASRWGRREARVDLSSRGVMDETKAAAILDGMLTRVEPRPGYANGFEVTRHQISHVGGSVACLPLIRAGHVVTLHGVVDESLTPKPWHDIVIAEVRHTPGLAYIEPLGLAARNLAAVLEGKSTTGLAA